jgi:hypothetical protein
MIEIIKENPFVFGFIVTWLLLLLIYFIKYYFFK